MCVCVFFITLPKKMSSRNKKLDVHVKLYFAFCACFYISNKYIIVSVIQSGGKHKRGSNRITFIKLGKNCKSP